MYYYMYSSTYITFYVVIFLKTILEDDHKFISVVGSVKYTHAFALIVLL